MSRARFAAPRSVTPLTLIAAIAILLFAAAPAAATNGASITAAARVIEQTATFPGTAWGIDTQTNQVLVTVDSTVRGAGSRPSEPRFSASAHRRGWSSPPALRGQDHRR